MSLHGEREGSRFGLGQHLVHHAPIGVFPVAADSPLLGAQELDPVRLAQELGPGVGRLDRADVIAQRFQRPQIGAMMRPLA